MSETTLSITSIMNNITKNNKMKGGSTHRYPNAYKLLNAFENNNTDLINVLINENLIETLVCQDSLGNTILHNLVIAATENPDNSECLFKHFKKLSIRPDFKEAVNIRNHDNKTAFYVAVEFANQNNDDNLFKFATILDEAGAEKVFGNNEIITENQDNQDSKGNNITQYIFNISPQSETANESTLDLETLAKFLNNKQIGITMEQEIDDDEQDQTTLDISVLRQMLQPKSKVDSENLNTDDLRRMLESKYSRNMPKDVFSETSNFDPNIFANSKMNSMTSNRFEEIVKNHYGLVGGKNVIRGSRKLNSFQNNSESSVRSSNELGKMLKADKDNKSSETIVSKDQLHKKLLEKIKELLADGKLKVNKKVVEHTDNNALTIKSYLYRTRRQKYAKHTGRQIIEDLVNMKDADLIKKVKDMPDIEELRSSIIKESEEKRKNKPKKQRKDSTDNSSVTPFTNSVNDTSSEDLDIINSSF